MTKTFPTLYARGNNGKVLEWSITVTNDMFSVTSGAQGAKKVTAKPTVCTPKNTGRSNETTGNEQALLEAEAKWTKKKKSGGYWESVSDIDETTFIEPMLAKQWKDRKDKIDISKGLIAQLKFNGMRAVATKNGIHTRKGERYVSIPHIEESLVKFFEKYPNASLDGEMFNEDLREQLNEIAKLLRRTEHITAEHLKNSEKMVRYYVYDGWGIEGTTEQSPFTERKAAIDKVLPQYCKYFVPVKDYIVKSEEELDKVYQKFIEAKHEGVILRMPNSPYERKRSNNLLKLKPTDDSEMLIIDIEEGLGNWSGVAKTLTLEMPNKKQFRATFKGTKDEAAEFLKNKNQWIGKVVTIHYNGMTGLGVPNFAQFDYKNSNKGDR